MWNVESGMRNGATQTLSHSYISITMLNVIANFSRATASESIKFSMIYG